jgi:hypothetical protein
MRFLIDGYNLMYALGLMARALPAGGLAKGRDRFLDWLAEHATPRAGDAFRVVFDARNAPGPSDSRQTHGPIHVVYAVGRNADDLIEELLAAEAAPRGLTVVSNDRRLQDAARRRGSAAWACEAFLDFLDAGDHRPPLRPDPPPDKPDDVPPGEVADWLRVFGEKK